MKFAAIDVETANEDLASICQIGIATYQDYKLIDEWSSLINPEDYFSGMNISIHGIWPEMVEGKPTFAELAHEVHSRLDNEIAVCHTYFDRVATIRVCEKYGIRPPTSRWLDSARVTRRTWKDRARSGYGLREVCDFLGYEFQHHDALEDAKAAANILMRAIENTGLDLGAWLARVNEPIDPSLSLPITREGNPDGDFFGEVIVFTGALRMLRREAADLAAQVGCRVESGVTKRTTLLVVGDQDLGRLAGHKKSSKHRKAEALIEGGQRIRILRESDFLEVVKHAQMIIG